MIPAKLRRMSRCLAAALCTVLLASASAQAQDMDCGACTELDRQTMADPVPPQDLRPPEPRFIGKGPDHRGKAIDVPGTGVTVYHKPGAGIWIGDYVPGGVFVRPRQNKFSIDMRF